MPTAQLQQAGCHTPLYGCLGIHSFVSYRIYVALQERLEAIKREQEVEAERECTFQPAINGRSARLMAERSEVLKVQKPLTRYLMSSGCVLLLPTSTHMVADA